MTILHQEGPMPDFTKNHPDVNHSLNAPSLPKPIANILSPRQDVSSMNLALLHQLFSEDIQVKVFSTDNEVEEGESYIYLSIQVFTPVAGGHTLSIIHDRDGYNYYDVSKRLLLNFSIEDLLYKNVLTMEQISSCYVEVRSELDNLKRFVEKISHELTHLGLSINLG